MIGALGALAAAISSYAGAPIARSVVAVVLVYVCGYVAGALLVAPHHDRTSLSLGCIRLVGGLLLSSLAFLWSLQLSLPWFVGPAVVVATALAWAGSQAVAPPRPVLTLTAGGAIAAMAAMALTAPPVVSALTMAPGDFPPVYLNVDVPYFLEKVHALVQAEGYPPESLSVVGGQRPYHFGLHGVAALVARGSGLAPHHAVFAVLVPLLATGIVAAAVFLARTLAPVVSPAISVPLLLLSVPTLWYDFWLNVVPRLGDAVASRSAGPIEALASNWEMWGVTSNIQNLGAHFLVLALLAAWAQAGTLGWPLACFLAGSAIAFKSPTGVALMAGFCLVQAWRVVAQRSLRPVVPVVGAVSVFLAVYGTLWVLLPIPAELRAVLRPLFQLEYVEGHGGLWFFASDVAWLMLPALVVLPAARGERDWRSVALGVFALGPFLAVNTLRLVDLRRDYGVSSMNEDDWRQIMMPVPVLLHAVVVSVVGHRWPRLSRAARAACVAACAAAVVPPVYVAGRYGQLVVENPSRGHEFADNRALGEALAAVPVSGSVIVTNDLRYPADGFRREDRQMQIPSLFGHQAFAVNYFYESYPFSPQRKQLQALLTNATWTPEVEAAARTYGWTHLVVHAPYTHPANIPLERIFDNGTYAVYRFAGG